MRARIGLRDPEHRQQEARVVQPRLSAVGRGSVDVQQHRIHTGLTDLQRRLRIREQRDAHRELAPLARTQLVDHILERTDEVVAHLIQLQGRAQL